MMILKLLFLMPTAILASSYDNYGNYQHSMDYNNDPRNAEVKPAPNIIFNFEQLRRDQPPQIEMRDESLGPYMHRSTRPPTTTTMAPIYAPRAQVVPENKGFDRVPYPGYSSMPIPVPTAHQRPSTSEYPQYNSNPSTPMPSPPPAPKWSDFSEAFNKPPFPHQEPRKTFEAPTVPEFNHAQQQLQPKPSRPQENQFDQRMPSLPEFNGFQRPQQPIAPVETRDQVNYDSRRNSMTPVRSPPSSVPEHYSSQSRPNHSNSGSRGSHKFSWNDVTTEPSWSHAPPKMSSTSAPVVQGKVPPPLATLSPWLDGFGK